MANVHQSAAENMAKTDKYNGAVAKGMLTQLNLNRLATERDRKDFKGGGGGRAMTAKQHRNDVLNYKYKSQIDDAREQNRHVRNMEGATHVHGLGEDAKKSTHKMSESAKRSAHKLEETRRNNDVERTRTTLGHAKEHGSLASVDFSHKDGRHQITFGADHEGYGHGGQGGSKQQEQPGGRRSGSTKGKGKGKGRSPLITRHVDSDAAAHGEGYRGTTKTARQWQTEDAKAKKAAAKPTAKKSSAKSTRGKKA